MKTFVQFLNEAALGDCLETAGRGVAFFDLGRERLNQKLKADGATANKIKLVHGYVTGQGKVEGKRFVHAWVEYGNKVYDFSNGGSYVLDRKGYYAAGRVDEKNSSEYRTYNQDQTVKKILSTKHWGPWDI